LENLSDELRSQWHPSFNLPRTIETTNVSAKVWWLGKCGHEWETATTERLRGSNCPVCDGKKILIGFNDFASQNPKLAESWHPTKNLPLLPTQVTPKNGTKKIWWLCDLAHEWQASINHRANGSGCPFCAGNRVLSGFNDLATVNPSLASKWHPTKNTIQSPTLISPNDKKKVWWICDEGHEWFHPVEDRHRRNPECYFCSGFKVLRGVTDMATTNPKLAAEWHPTKNTPITPEMVSGTKGAKRWWICSLNHEWEATIYSRSRGSGCPVCSGNRVVEGFNDLNSRSPHLMKEWHPTKNTLSPKEVSWSSGLKAWWICDNGHEWNTQISNRNNGSGCPVCTNRIVLQGENDFLSSHPEIAKSWHPTKNIISPSEITYGTQQMVWWLCEANHEWQQTPAHRSKGTGCPYCSGNKVLIGFNDLATINPTLTKEWHPTKNLPLTAQSLTYGSKVKIWWTCPKGHDWKCSPNERQYTTTCVYCSGAKVLAGFNDLATTHPILLRSWHPIKNRPVRIQEVSAGSGFKAWWICEKGHEWKSVVSDRSRGFGCPTCVNRVSKPELAIKSFLESLNLTVETSDRKILKGKEIDLYIPAKKVGIEFNGIYWHTEENGKDSTYHYDKWRVAKSAGVELIQIWEDDFRDRKDAVLKILARKLGVTNHLPAIHPAYAEEAVVSDSADLEAVTLAVDVAGDFLRENAVQGFTAGSHYLGLRTNDGTLKDVLVLDAELNGMSVISYTSVGLVEGGFRKLLEYATATYSPASFVAVSDNCLPSDDLFLSHGFVPVEEVQPDYKYVVNNDRRDASEYDVARFKNDSVLVYQAGLDVPALATLNNMPKIWDAGGMKYRLTL